MFGDLPELIYGNTRVYLLVKNCYFSYPFQVNFFSVIPQFDAPDSVLRKWQRPVTNHQRNYFCSKQRSLSHKQNLLIIFIPSTGLCFFTPAIWNSINLVVNRRPRRSLFMLGDGPSWWAACYIQAFRLHYVTNIWSYNTAFIHSRSCLSYKSTASS